MPAFSLARLQEDLVGRRMTSERASEYMATFAEFNTGQLRQLVGRLGLPSPENREAALEKLNEHLTVAFSPGNGGSESMPLWNNEGGASPGKGGKTSYCGASYESPGSGGSESMPLWNNEGGASPGKGGKASDAPPVEAPSGDGKAEDTSDAKPEDAVVPPVDAAPDDKDEADDDTVAEPLKSCPGCPGKNAAMAVDVGGDGDDDSGPLTPEHVLAEAGKNGVTDPGAAQTLAAETLKDQAMSHTKVHSLYDLVRSLTAGGAMTQADAAQRAASLGSVDALRSAAAQGDPFAAKVAARIPSEFSAEYWGGVVLAGGRPRTRLAVFAEFCEAGVPQAYTAQYLAESPPFDMGGEWAMLPGRNGQVRVRVGFDGTVTAGAVGLVGRPSEGAITKRHHPALFAARRLAAASLHAVSFEQARDPNGKFGGGGSGADTSVSSGKLEKESAAVGKEHMQKAAGEKRPLPTGDGHSAPKPAEKGGKTIWDLPGMGGSDAKDKVEKGHLMGGSKDAGKDSPKSGGFGGLVRRMLGKGGKDGPAGFAIAPATTGLYLKAHNRPGKLAAQFATAMRGATPSGFDPEYYWDEFVHGPNGRTLRADALAQFLDRGYSVAGAGEAAGRAEFVSVGTARSANFDYSDMKPKAEKSDNKPTPDADGKYWMTIQGPAGRAVIEVDEGGNITKGPTGLKGRPADEALSDHAHEMAAAAKQKAKEHGDKARSGEHGDKGEHGGHTTHGEMEHHAHSISERVMHFAHKVEPIIHFLLHPGATAVAEIFGARIAGRLKKTEAKAEKLHGWAKGRYGEHVANAAFTLAAGISLANHVVPLQAALPKNTRAALNVVPALAIAEVGLRAHQATKAGGKVVGKGLGAVKKGFGGLLKLIRGKGKGKAVAADSTAKAEMSASVGFKRPDLNDSAIDMPFEKLHKIATRISKKLVAHYQSDLKSHASSVKAISDAIEQARKLNRKSSKVGKPDDAGGDDAKGGGKPFKKADKKADADVAKKGGKDGGGKGDKPKGWLKTGFSADAPVEEDGHAKATKLARKLARHARSGKVSIGQLSAGLKSLGALPAPHVQTAARSLGLGGPLGGKAVSKTGALKRIAAHVRTHAKIAAAEMHATAGLPPEPAALEVACFNGMPRTLGWIEAELRRAGVPSQTAAQFSLTAEPFVIPV